MKKYLIVFFIVLTLNIFAQEANETSVDVLVKPIDGKCIVYIARREPIAMLLKFPIYDGDLLLGKLGANHYYAYECNPGEHIFVCKGENTFYIEADLSEGKVYVLDLRVEMGILSARVKLVPLCVSSKKFEKEKNKFLSFVRKKKGELLSINNEDFEVENEDDDSVVDLNKQSKRLSKFYEMKSNGKKIAQITQDMYFEE